MCILSIFTSLFVLPPQSATMTGRVVAQQAPRLAASGKGERNLLLQKGGATLTANTSHPQQIIVIPQSLLQQSNKKPILRVSPSSIAPITIPAVTTDSSMASSKIGLKRPLPPLKSSSQPDSKKPLLSESADQTPVRKRANLDHLSPEEKLMRRKLKNRVAAQNARDKKRAKLDDMEILIQKLQDENDALKEQNEQLLEVNQKLNLENSRLKENNSEAADTTTTTTISVPVKIEMPSSPISLPRSPAPSPSPEDTTTTTTTFSSSSTATDGDRVRAMPVASASTEASGNAPQQQDQAVVVSRASEPAEPTNVLLPKGQARETAAEQATAATALAATACLFWTCLQASSAAKVQQQQQQPPSQTQSTTEQRLEEDSRESTSSQCQQQQQQRRQQQSSAAATTAPPPPPKKRLPLKKRGGTWWGPQQRSWSAAATPT